MEITLLGFLLGLVLLVIPIYVIYVLDLRRMRRFLTSLAMMCGQVAVTGGATYLLLKWNSVLITVLSGTVMALVSALLTLRKANLHLSKTIFPVAVGVLVSTFVIALYVLFLVFGLKNPFDARFFVPVFGLLTGCTIGVNSHALHIYYMGLHHHSQLYYYMLGNGSTHREATQYFVRRAFQASLNPVMWLMSGIVLTNAPVVMLTLVLSGVGVATAVALQILLYVMVVAVAFASLGITLLIGRKYNFDEYEKLKPVTDKASPMASSASVSPTSANLSAPQHTDFENLQQEAAPETHQPE